MISEDRKKLPYRETSDCFLLYKNKLVCMDTKHYLKFPGGGIDEGEKIHLLIGKVANFVNPTSSEGDSWTGNILMSLDKVLKKHEDYVKTEHVNVYPYRIGQYAILKMLKEKCKSN